MVFLIINHCRTHKVFVIVNKNLKVGCQIISEIKSSQDFVMQRELKIGKNKISNCDYVPQCLKQPYQYPTHQILLLFSPATVFFLCF